MRKKVLTIDCVNCKLCIVDDTSNFICNWGKTPKIMEDAKGKKSLKCKLIKKSK